MPCLSIERAAAEEMLDKEHGLPQDRNDANIYTLSRSSGHNVVIACLPARQMGTNLAAAGVSQMTSKFMFIKFGLIGGGF